MELFSIRIRRTFQLVSTVSYRLAAFLMIKVTFIDFQVEFYSAANIDIFPTFSPHLLNILQFD